MDVHKDKLDWGLEFLGDILQNSIYSYENIEAEKSTINTELLECFRDQPPTLVEFAHANCYRNHPLGKPVLGRKENIDSVERDMLTQFHELNYTG